MRSMKTRALLIATLSGVLLVGGLAFMGGRYVQQHPSTPTTEDRVSACTTDAMEKLTDVDTDLYASTLIKVQAACEKRLG